MKRGRNNRTTFVMILLLVGIYELIVEFSLVNFSPLDTPEIQFWKNVLYIGAPILTVLGIIVAALANSKINSLQAERDRRVKIEQDSLKKSMEEKPKENYHVESH